jgi:hypothetical protein
MKDTCLLLVVKGGEGKSAPDPFGDYQVIGGDLQVTLHVSVDRHNKKVWVWGCEADGLERKGISCALRGSQECPVVRHREGFEKWTRVGFESAPPFSIKNVLIPDDPCPMDPVSCV